MKVLVAPSSTAMPLHPFFNFAPVIDAPMMLFSMMLRLPPRKTMPSPAFPLMMFGAVPPMTLSDESISEIPAGPEPGAAVPSAVVPIRLPSIRFPRVFAPSRTRPDPVFPDNTLS